MLTRAPANADMARPAVSLGMPVSVAGPPEAAPVPTECDKRSPASYVIEPPDVVFIQGSPAIGQPSQPLRGTYVLRPDGTVSLGIYGDVCLGGLTIAQARNAVAEALIRYGLRVEKIDDRGNRVDVTCAEVLGRELQVDLVASKSKFYYVIITSGGQGQKVFRVPSMGNETVLDAIGQIGGLPTAAGKKKIWVARATPNSSAPVRVLPVDWRAITQDGAAATNYQIYPGDRVYIQSDPPSFAGVVMNKILTPFRGKAE